MKPYVNNFNFNKKRKLDISRLLFSITNDESGFILVLTMFILVILSIIGLSATDLTTIELIVSGNDRIHKETFFRADGGVELGTRLTYDNAICSQVNGGFNANRGTSRDIKSPDNIVRINVENIDFAINNSASSSVSDSNRDIVYYPDGIVRNADGSYDNGTPHTNILLVSKTKLTGGSSALMVSGYEGLGVSSVGGTEVTHSIKSQHNGIRNSSSLITVGWKMNAHIINSAALSDCDDIYKTN